MKTGCVSTGYTSGFIISTENLLLADSLVFILFYPTYAFPLPDVI